MERFAIMGVDQSLNSTGVCVYSAVKRTVKGTPKINICRPMYYNILPEQKVTKKLASTEHESFKILTYFKQEGNDYESKELAKTTNIMAICSHIGYLIETWHPDALVMEGISYGSVGSASLIDLAGLNFCIRQLAIKHGTPVRLASPMTVKKLATGNGGALKEEMVWAWRNCDKLIKDLDITKVDDLADAYWLARIYEDEYIK